APDPVVRGEAGDRDRPAGGLSRGDPHVGRGGPAAPRPELAGRRRRGGGGRASGGLAGPPRRLSVSAPRRVLWAVVLVLVLVAAIAAYLRYRLENPPVPPGSGEVI